MGDNPIGGKRVKPIEKVEYRGQYRVIGIVKNGSTTVGYSVVDLKTGRSRLFTSVQVHQLLAQSKFENIELRDNKLVNTESSMDRLPQMNVKGVVTANAGITVLGRITTTKGSHSEKGYRILNMQGKIADLSDKALDMLLQENKNMHVVNGKIVASPSGQLYISAIKGTFKTIQVTFDDQGNKKDNVIQPSKEDIRKYNLLVYREKAIRYFFEELIQYGFIKPFFKPNTNKSYGKGRANKARVVLKEFIYPNYPELKELHNALPAHIITLGMLMYLVDKGNWRSSGKTSVIYDTNNSTKHRKIPVLAKYKFRNLFKGTYTMAVESQWVFTEKESFNKVVDYLAVLNGLFNAEIFEKVNTEKVDYPIDHPQLKFILKHYLGKYRAVSVTKSRFYKVEYNPAHFDYRDESGVNVMGYTSMPSKVGQEFESPVYKYIKLRPLQYGLKEFLSPSFTAEDLYESINCFGDLEIIREIIIFSRIRDSIRETSYSASYADDVRVWIKGLVVLMAMHNPNLAVQVNKRFNLLDVEDDIFANLAKEDFFLTPEDELFYWSGTKFNRSITLKSGNSWGDLHLNKVPVATYQAISLFLTQYGGVDTELPEERPYKG